MAELTGQIDHLAGNQQETLGSWIADARAAGDTPQEKGRFAQEAKAIVTVWSRQGPLYKMDGGFDPEGLLGTMPAVVMCWAAIWRGRPFKKLAIWRVCCA